MSSHFCKTYPFGSQPNLKYVVILSEYEGKLLLSRHKDRQTFETQGGHIEPNETAWQAARRELYEESGAIGYTLYPVCDYRAGDKDGYANGAVFAAHIELLAPLPEFEMAEVKQFDALPEDNEITYPWITPTLWKEAREKLRLP